MASGSGASGVLEVIAQRIKMETDKFVRFKYNRSFVKITKKMVQIRKELSHSPIKLACYTKIYGLSST